MRNVKEILSKTLTPNDLVTDTLCHRLNKNNLNIPKRKGDRHVVTRPQNIGPVVTTNYRIRNCKRLNYLRFSL